MKKRIAIALSGGVDSLVAAYLLKEQGYDLTGIHFLTGYEQSHNTGASSSPNPISFIGDQLDIKIHILDCAKEFKDKVIKYFYKIYRIGQTPNPCMVCNPTIKFGTVLNHAHSLGISYMATGHYAKIIKDKYNRNHLFRGSDNNKDQSYFLAFMSQQQLSSAVFPIGDMTKSHVRDIANKNDLKPVINNESQDICFIRDRNYKEFLSDQLNIDEKPGHIVDLDGQVIGTHTGLHKYTIGQRRGINIPSSEPYYVVKIDTERNQLIIGRKDDLLCSEFKVSDINWIIETPDNPIEIKTRVRYRSKAYETTLSPVSEKSALVRFKTPQSSVAPGQAAVFYRDNEVLGGGWILPNQ